MNDPSIAQLNLPPGMIDFGVGQPSPALLPLAQLKKAAASRLDENDPSFLAYGANPVSYTHLTLPTITE